MSYKLDLEKKDMEWICGWLDLSVKFHRAVNEGKIVWTELSLRSGTAQLNNTVQSVQWKHNIKQRQHCTYPSQNALWVTCGKKNGNIWVKNKSIHQIYRNVSENVFRYWITNTVLNRTKCEIKSWEIFRLFIFYIVI